MCVVTLWEILLGGDLISLVQGSPLLQQSLYNILEGNIYKVRAPYSRLEALLAVGLATPHALEI